MDKKLVIYGFLGLLASSAVVAVGMTRSPKMQTSGTVPTDATSQMNHHSPGHSNDMNLSGMQDHPQGNDSHSGHGANDQKTPRMGESAQAKLTIPETLVPNQPEILGIDIQDRAGKAITKFDTFQEKLLHLIVVSDDLQFFNHLHPTYKGNGNFEVEANFPQPGSYTLFSDYKPSGQTEQVSVLKTQVPGESSSSSVVDLNHTKTFDDTKVNLTFSEATVKAGQEITLIFNLKQTSNNQTITDLQPYLGERGHLVSLKQSSPLTRKDYIHSHALKNSPDGKVQFMTRFPEPGTYKLWGQFNRNGKIVVADFWINVL